MPLVRFFLMRIGRIGFSWLKGKSCSCSITAMPAMVRIAGGRIVIGRQRSVRELVQDIKEPESRVALGYPRPSPMPKLPLSDVDIEAIASFLKTQ
jgi:hypothetical protein